MTNSEHSVAYAQTRDAELWALGLTSEVIARLRHRRAFDDAATKLSAVVADLGCAGVAGVSPIGQKLASAVAVAIDVPLVAGGAVPAGRIAFVEAVINSGVNLVKAMRTARASGATDVVGVALVAQTVAIATWRAEGEALISLEEV
jgi:hypothetical protein